MLGLGDEHPNTADDGNASAARPQYAQTVRDQTGQVVDRSASSDSAMSSGATVEAAHCASFREALKITSSSQEWSL
jgi:hypothetical protein